MIWVNKKGQPIAIKGQLVDCDKCPCDPCLDNECIFTPVYSPVFHMPRYGGLLSPYSDVNFVKVNNIVLPMVGMTLGDGAYNGSNVWVASSDFSIIDGDDQHNLSVDVRYYAEPIYFQLKPSGEPQNVYKAYYDLYYTKYVNGIPVYVDSIFHPYTARYYHITLLDKFILNDEGVNVLAGSSIYPGSDIVLNIPEGNSTAGKYDLQEMLNTGKITVTPPDFVEYFLNRFSCYYSNVTIAAEPCVIEFGKDDNLRVGIYTPTVPGCPCGDGVYDKYPIDFLPDIVDTVGGGESSSSSAPEHSSGTSSSESSESCPLLQHGTNINSVDAYSEVVVERTAEQNLELIVESVHKLGAGEYKYILHQYNGKDIVIDKPGNYYFPKGTEIFLTLEVSSGVVGSISLNYRICPIEEIPGKCVWVFFYRCVEFKWVYQDKELKGFFPGNTADEAGYIDGEERIDGEYKVVTRMIDSINICPSEEPIIPDGGICACNGNFYDLTLYPQQYTYYIKDPASAGDEMLVVDDVVLPVYDGYDFVLYLTKFGNEIERISVVTPKNTYKMYGGGTYALELVYDYDKGIPENGTTGKVKINICKIENNVQENLLSEMGE